MHNKKFLFQLLLIALFHSYSFSQNWNVITPFYKYNYSPNLSGYEKTITIHVDSTKISGADSVYYLNRILVPYGTDKMIKNAPQFLQRKMIKKNNGDVIFQDPTSFLIKPLNSVGSSWIFDTLNSISAQVASSNYISILGNFDSIKYIILSSLDTIIVSKNYGLVRFSNSYISPIQYFLSGIEGPNIGLLVPGFKDIFDFNIGDVFEYYKHYDHITGTVFSSWHENTNYKYTIQSKNLIGDTIIYGVYVFKKDTIYAPGSGNPIQNASFSDYPLTIKYINCDSNYVNFYNNQQIVTGNYYQKIFLYSDTVFKVKGKGFNTRYTFSGTDTLIEANSPPGVYYQNSEQYASGRGLVDFHVTDYFMFSSQSRNHTDSVLTGCKINGTTYGTLHPDSFFTDVKNPYLEINDFFIYPNPFTVEINITSNGNEVLDFSLFDVWGKNILNRSFICSASINISWLQKGIYLFEVKYKNGFCKKGKLVKM